MKATKAQLDRVIVTRPILGITGMQVCCVKDATDEEILKVCNTQNPSGTTGGWQVVVRDENSKYAAGPVVCDDDKDRLHIVIIC